MVDIRGKKPILIGGLGLAGAWVLLEGVHQVVETAGGLLTWGIVAAGAGMWWLNRRPVTAPRPVAAPPPPTDRAAAEQAIARAQAMLDQLQQDSAGSHPWPIAPWQAQLASLRDRLDRPWLTGAIVGGPAVGKSALVAALTTLSHSDATGTRSALAWQWREGDRLFSDPLDTAPDAVATHPADPAVAILPDQPPATVATPAALFSAADLLAADLLVLVVAGDLTEPEFQFVRAAIAQQQPVLVALNKQDRYVPADRQAIVERIAHQLHGDVERDHIVTVAAQPAPLLVRRHQADGTTQESWEQPAPEIQGLQTAVAQVSGRSLQWQTVQRLALVAIAEMRPALNRERRDRAMPLVEQSQWIAAAAAFANPLPGVDLLATAAVNGQLVMDLGQVYHQSFSLDRAQAVAQTLAELMIKLGLVELSTQVIGTALKANAMTYVAGGAVQGVSAAYLTRVAGLSLMETFETLSAIEGDRPAHAEDWFSRDRLTATLRSVFERTRQMAGLQGFLNQALQHLGVAARTPATP